MESVETPSQQQQIQPMQSGNKIYIYVAFGIIIILFIALVVFLATRKEKTTLQSNAVKKITTPTSTPTPMIYDGSMELTKTDNTAIHSFGKSLVLTLTADSKGNDVTGYDAVIMFNPSLVRFKSVKSLVSDMTIFKYTKDNLVQITGTKSLSSTSLVFFNKTPILEYVFEPLQKGVVEFEVIDRKGKAKSQIVNSKSKPVLVNPSKTTITIQ